ncbi:alanine:cation symporter family protein [Lysinibacillus agricola]
MCKRYHTLQKSLSAASEVSYPAKQGFVQGFSIYIDTIVVCMVTTLMILI